MHETQTQGLRSAGPRGDRKDGPPGDAVASRDWARPAGTSLRGPVPGEDAGSAFPVRSFALVVGCGAPRHVCTSGGRDVRSTAVARDRGRGYACARRRVRSESPDGP